MNSQASPILDGLLLTVLLGNLGLYTQKYSLSLGWFIFGAQFAEK